MSLNPITKVVVDLSEPLNEWKESKSLNTILEEQTILLSAYSPHPKNNNAIDKPFQVSFKSIPKFKVIKTLIEPKIIAQLSDYGHEECFSLELNDIKAINTTIQLRVAIITDIITKIQYKDSVPEYLCIHVNGRQVFSYKEGNEFCGPFDLKPFCINGNNRVQLLMSKKDYVFLMPCLLEVSVVSVNTPELYLKTLMENKSLIYSIESTKQLIKTRTEPQLKSDDLIMDSDIKVKLICPFTLRQLAIPCRTVHCQHIECFDALTFLKTNESKSDWFCPFCRKSAHFEALRIDEYLTQVLKNANKNVKQISIKSDATYEAIETVDSDPEESDDNQ